MDETPEQTTGARPGGRGGELFYAIVDESPVIALGCMLAICLGGIFFVVRRPDYATPALELLVLILFSKVSLRELLDMAGSGGKKPAPREDNAIES